MDENLLFASQEQHCSSTGKLSAIRNDNLQFSVNAKLNKHINMFDWRIKKESIYPNRDYRSCNYSGDWTKRYINDYVDSLINNGVMTTQENLAGYKDEHLPKSLYKFYPASIYSLINIENNSLYLSSPKNFNDPFDSYMCIEDETFIKIFLLKRLKELDLVSKNEDKNKVTEKEYYKIYNSWTKDDIAPFRWKEPRLEDFTLVLFHIRDEKSDEFSQFLYSVVEEARSDCRKKINYIRNLEFKISCFSNFLDEDELLKNTTMWSHYADNHHGFCVKYNLDLSNLRNSSLIKCGLFPVKYTSKIPKISPRELMKLKFINNDLKLSNPVLKTAYKTLTTKSIFWNYEKEWRLIISSHNSDVLTNNIIQFVNIEAIYLGCRIEENLKRHLINFAENNKIEIFQTIQSNEKFQLKKTELHTKDFVDKEFFDKLSKIKLIENNKDRHVKTMNLYDDLKNKARR